MRVLVAYDSVFGNTERVANAIAEGLRERVEVEVDVRAVASLAALRPDT